MAKIKKSETPNFWQGGEAAKASIHCWSKCKMVHLEMVHRLGKKSGGFSYN